MARPISTEHATGTSVCPPFARRVICEASGSLRYCSFNGFWRDRISMATSFLYSRLFFVEGDSLGQVVGQFHEATRKTHEPQRTRRDHEGLIFRVSFAYLRELGLTVLPADPLPLAPLAKPS